jgi:hypothetical protein
MTIFDQMKSASELMKGMTPEQISQLMQRATDSKREIEDLIRKIVGQEIEKKNFISKEDAEKIFLKK